MKSPKKWRCGCSAILRSALSASQGKTTPRQPGFNIEPFSRFWREAHQLVVESTTAVVDLMRQRGVGPVQMVCPAEVLEPLQRHSGVEAVHFGRLDQRQDLSTGPLWIPNRILNSLLNFTSWSTDSSLHQATSSFPRRHGVFLR